MPSISGTRNALRAWLTPIRRYERHISAAAMVAGFAIDDLTFGRIDRPATQIIFLSYLIVAAASIAILHAMQSAADRFEQRELKARWSLRRRRTPPSAASDTGPPADRSSSAEQGVAPATTNDDSGNDVAAADPRRTFLLAATQFAIGGLSSAFLVFYSRSASFASSWLFILVLVCFLIGNEIFKKYHSRLVFSALLLFFSLYSYFIFIVPVLTKAIGKITFIASGAIAVFVFLLFLRLLARIGCERFRQSRLALLGGVIVVTAAMNGFYFTSILPPLPLALTDVGIFDSVKKVGNSYVAVSEPQSWYATFGFEPAVVHVVPGSPLSLYSAVYAPVQLTTSLSHRWQYYNRKQRRWVTVSTVSFPISGGREGGYRAYSIKSAPKAGDWRVDIETEDGRLVGRLRFVVVDVAKPVPTVRKVMS